MYRYTPTYIRYTHYTGQTFSAELRKLQVISLLHLLNIYTEKRQLHDNYLFYQSSVVNRTLKYCFMINSMKKRPLENPVNLAIAFIENRNRKFKIHV